MNTKIRDLKYSDRLRLSAMIKKLSSKLEDDTLLKLVSSSNDKTEDNNDNADESNYVKIALKLFNLLVEFLEEDIGNWFADLLEVDIDEFKLNAPFDIEIIVLNQLLEEKGRLKSFLAGASQLYNTMSGLKNRLTTMKK